MKIDTSTTAGKIAVMQAFESGKNIQLMLNCEEIVWVDFNDAGRVIWNWERFNYRIKPQTSKEAAECAAEGIFFSGGMPSRDFFIRSFVLGAEWKAEQEL